MSRGRATDAGQFEDLPAKEGVIVTRDEKLRKVLGLFIVAVISALSAYGGVKFTDSGEEPEPVTSITPAPRAEQRAVESQSAPQPVKVRLLMQRDAMCGEPVDLIALVEGGPAKSCEFRVVPDGDWLRDSRDMLRNTFTSDVPGEYIVFLTVSSPDGSVSTDLGVIDMVSNEVPVPFPVEVPAESSQDEEMQGGRARPSRQRLELADVKRSHFADAVRELARRVDSPSILVDIPIVATALRSSSKAILTGQLGDRTPTEYMTEFATAQLNDAAPAWQSFFHGVDQLLGALAALGLVFDDASLAMAFADAATVLEGAGPN